jgi:hypothetical protein
MAAIFASVGVGKHLAHRRGQAERLIKLPERRAIVRRTSPQIRETEASADNRNPGEVPSPRDSPAEFALATSIN